MRNVKAIPQAAGTSLENAISATFILAEEEDFPVPTKSGSNDFRSIRWQGAQLPVNSIGKVLKRELQRIALTELGESDFNFQPDSYGLNK